MDTWHYLLILCIIVWYLYWPKFVKILQAATRECALLNFYFIIKHWEFSVTIAFSITIGPGMGCHLEHNAVNNFINTLSNCTNLGSLPFTLSPDATNNCNWSFCFFISCAVDNPTLYEALNMFWLVLLSSLLLLQVSEESLMLHVSSHQHYLVYPSWDLLE